MARTRKNDLLLSDIHGQLGKQLVVKQYDYGTVVTKYPDMSRVKRTSRQKQNNGRFKEAVLYAQSIIRNPDKRAAYVKKLARSKKTKATRSVYHAAISEFLNK